MPPPRFRETTRQYLYQSLLYVIILCSFSSNALKAQTFECGTPDPNDALYQMILSRVSEKLTFSQNRNPEQVVEIPIFFTVFRSSTGIIGNGVGTPITNSSIDERIDFLNSKFSGSGVHFHRLGNVNYIDYTLFHTTSPGGITRENYSYVKTALNIYISPVDPTDIGFTNLPNSNLYGAPVQYNTSLLTPQAFVNSTSFVHETGHNFGLLHTFGPASKENGDPILFDYPKVLDPVQGLTVYDHPYEGNRRRELAIRQNSAGKAFPSPNCQTSGDFCCDTEADCYFKYPYTFPDFAPVNVASCLQQSGACTGGCSNNGCTYTGTYRDYNGDLIPGCFNNIMSYKNLCGFDFTPEQKDWIAFWYNSFWSTKLADLPINVNDKVELRGSSIPMKNVVIRWKHPNPDRYTNCTTNSTGDFQGVLYAPTTKAEVRKIGSIREVAGTFPGQSGPQEFYTDAYTYADWIKDIDVEDLIRIYKHVGGSGALNGDGYNLIAADADHSNSITLSDYIVLKRLLLGQYQKLPAFNAPWRFIPEYIPQDNLAQFNADPFNMTFSTINGQNPLGTPYTEPTWEYEIPVELNKRGYDGIKIGDVFGESSPMQPCEQNAELAFPSAPLLAPGQSFDVTLKATGLTNVESFQLGLFIDHTKLEVLDVSSNTLPEFTQTNNVGLTQLENDQMNILWFQSNISPTTIGSQTEFIKLKVKALQPVTDLVAALNFNAILPTKIFKLGGCTETPLPIQGFITPSLGSRPSDRDSDTKVRRATLYCCPNPANEQLNISFESNFNGQGTLRFSDSNGKTLLDRRVEVSEGINTLTLTQGELAGLPTGVIIVTLQTATGLQSGRLIKL